MHLEFDIPRAPTVSLRLRGPVFFEKRVFGIRLFFLNGSRAINRSKVAEASRL